MDKTKLEKQHAVIEAKASTLRKQRADLTADLAAARKMVEAEQSTGVAALLRRLTYDSAKMVKAQSDIALLPAAIAAVSRDLAEVEGSLGSVVLDLERVQADELLAHCTAQHARLVATLKTVGAEWDAYCRDVDALNQLPREVLPTWKLSPVREAAFSLTGLPHTLSVLQHFEAGGH